MDIIDFMDSAVDWWFKNSIPGWMIVKSKILGISEYHPDDSPVVSSCESPLWYNKWMGVDMWPIVTQRSAEIRTLAVALDSSVLDPWRANGVHQIHCWSPTGGTSSSPLAISWDYEYLVGFLRNRKQSSRGAFWSAPQNKVDVSHLWVNNSNDNKDNNIARIIYLYNHIYKNSE